MRGLVLPVIASLVIGLSVTTAPEAYAAVPPSACEQPVLAESPALDALRARLASADHDSVRLAALGSSTTYGMDLADPADRWTDKLMDGLAARGIAAAPGSVAPFSSTAISPTTGAVMVNAAVPGATSWTYLAEYLPALLLARASDNAPSIVFHMIGSNDYYSQTPPGVFAVALRASIKAIDQQTPAPIHVLISTYEDPARSGATYPWSSYGDAMKQVAAADPQHRLYIDLAPWFHAAEVPGADPYGLLDSGGVHPSPAGQQAIADLLLQALGYGC